MDTCSSLNYIDFGGVARFTNIIGVVIGTNAGSCGSNYLSPRWNSQSRARYDIAYHRSCNQRDEDQTPSRLGASIPTFVLNSAGGSKTHDSAPSNEGTLFESHAHHPTDGESARIDK
jgi:hypothetical protein